MELVDDDVDSLEEAIDYLHWLASDEPEELTEEEWARVREGQAQLARGEGVRWKEAKRRIRLWLGLTTLRGRPWVLLLRQQFGDWVVVG